MTARERVRSTQRLLGAGAVAHAIAWGVAVILGILAALGFITLIFPEVERDAPWQLAVAVISGLAVMGLLLWRARRLTSIERVALWIEERVPDLQYTLVTAIEHDRTPFTHGMEAAIARQDIAGVSRRALGRRVLPAVAAAAGALALLYVSPSPALGGGALFRRITGATAGAGPAGSRLERLTARITPPSYAGGGTTSLDDPSSIPALSGSRIVIRGRGESRGIAARAGTDAIPVADAGNAWTLSLVMPAKPAALTLRDREFERIIVLDPRADNPPRVVLTSPPRDSTLRAPRLVAQLRAAATDDIGLSGGYFEYLVTSGSGEIFSARTVTTPIVQFGRARSGGLESTLDLSSLGLKQGDVVSIRAIVQDGNTLTGPGLGTSDTRTFRVARADEYDSVAIDPAGPLPVDSSAMSQRMLIMMTEKLVREQKGITRAELVRRSTEIGDLEDRIRKRVHEILFEEDAENAESAVGAESAEGVPMGPVGIPETAGTLEEQAEASTAAPEEHTHSEDAAAAAARNPDLLEAYNALWEAVRALQIAEPGPALPPMRVALKALDRARLANRLYLRGLPPKIIVDLARVRMTGKDKGIRSIRTPRSPADSLQTSLQRRFNDAIEMIERRPSDAMRAFTLLQVDALATLPAVATPLAEAVDAFRKRRDATVPLLRARRALAGEPSSTPGLSAWSGGW